MRNVVFLCFAGALLAACADPLDRVERLDNVPLDEAATSQDVAADTDDAAPTGILAAMFGRARTEPAAAESEDARESSEAVIDAATSDDATRPRPTADLPEEDGTDAPVAEATPAQGGFLGLFRPRAAQTDTDPATPVAAQTAAVADDADGAAPVRVAAAGTAGGGLRGIFAGGADTGRADPLAPDIAPGGSIAFGALGRLCDVRAGSVGKEVARWPERGGKYRLYDSFPGSTAPRPFYISGFKDGCLRQFTGALAMFGSPQMHEQLRYGLPAKQLPYSDTDKGYEKIKSRVCRVSARQPCGKGIARLSRNTAFISYYDRFGGGQRWGNILLHDGKVVATDVKAK